MQKSGRWGLNDETVEKLAVLDPIKRRKVGNRNVGGRWRRKGRLPGELRRYGRAVGRGDSQRVSLGKKRSAELQRCRVAVQEAGEKTC